MIYSKHESVQKAFKTYVSSLEECLVQGTKVFSCKPNMEGVPSFSLGTQEILRSKVGFCVTKIKV